MFTKTFTFTITGEDAAAVIRAEDELSDQVFDMYNNNGYVETGIKVSYASAPLTDNPEA